MTKAADVRARVADLKVLITRDWREILADSAPDDRLEVRADLQWCVTELAWLLSEVERAEVSTAPDEGDAGRSR